MQIFSSNLNAHRKARAAFGAPKQIGARAAGVAFFYLLCETYLPSYVPRYFPITLSNANTYCTLKLFIQEYFKYFIRRNLYSYRIICISLFCYIILCFMLLCLYLFLFLSYIIFICFVQIIMYLGASADQLASP